MDVVRCSVVVGSTGPLLMVALVDGRAALTLVVGHDAVGRVVALHGAEPVQL